MVSRSRLLLVTAALFGGSSLAAPADDKPTTTQTACTAISTTGGSFFDLRPDIAVAPKTDAKKHTRGPPSEDYFVKGYDYPYNFTLNICEPVLKTPDRVVGLDPDLHQNVSAYYTTAAGDTYSIGYVAPSDLNTAEAQWILTAAPLPQSTIRRPDPEREPTRPPIRRRFPLRLVLVPVLGLPEEIHPSIGTRGRILQVLQRRRRRRLGTTQPRLLLPGRHCQYQKLPRARYRQDPEGRLSS